jgi:hypothetical protein
MDKHSDNKPRTWRQITPKEITQYKAAKVELGNGSAAIREVQPSYIAPHLRAFRLEKKSKEESTDAFIDRTLDTVAVDAVRRVGMMVNSVDERIATKNSHFVLEQKRGKAVQRIDSRNTNLNIQAVLD